KQKSGPQRECAGETVIQIRLLECNLATRFSAFDLGVLQLQLGVQGDPIAERIAGVDHEALHAHRAGRVGTGEVGVVDLPVPADGEFAGFVLGGEPSGGEQAESYRPDAGNQVHE